MNHASLTGLFAAVLLVAASPGPGVFTTVAAAIAGGFRAGLWAVAGIVTGHVLFVVLAMFGLALAAKAMGALFQWVKLFGALYLVGLGMKMWFAAPPVSDAGIRRQAGSAAGIWLRGLLVTLSNPKAILFYCGIFPLFTSASALHATGAATVSVVVALAFFSVLAGYAYAAGRARRLFSSKRAARRLNRTAGGMMMAAGAALASKA